MQYTANKSTVADINDEKKFPQAIGNLLAINDYHVQYSKKLCGAEIDIVATPKNSHYQPTLYIEATIQYVDNTKYGKDLTKFVLIKETDRRGICISISSKGFTPDVRERASQSDIQTLTYSEFFSGFEKFDIYVEQILRNENINSLISSYEPPYFSDKKGQDLATEWLKSWKDSDTHESNWLVVLGEYGTGKTALTLKILHDWITDYKENPKSPIPIRIELRNFTRQFDARSLIHHFLDKNGLSHIPIDFFFYLIKNKRIVLILDGYDEMAQFLNARERRACLAALAELASDGAKGILTSRPNYFTESEELNVFEALYSSLSQNKYYIGKIDSLYISEEQSIDVLLNNYLINKNERYLRDLTEDQTKSLVVRKLSGNLGSQKVVLNLLNKVFRNESGGNKQSLSGKPVIISYLLEVVEGMQSDANAESSIKDPADLTEWQIYKLIIDRLMLRDLQRSPTLLPSHRREALQNLAINLSGRDATSATEEMFLNIIDILFKSELRRLLPDERRLRRDELFQDLRSSTTLTRTEGSGSLGWIFSHNSLREYLAAEIAIGKLCAGNPIQVKFPISSAMRSFISSITNEHLDRISDSLRGIWSKRASFDVGAYFEMCFDLLLKSSKTPIQKIKEVCGTNDDLIDFNKITLKNIDFSILGIQEKLKITAIDSNFYEVNFNLIDLRDSMFSHGTFDKVSFAKTNIRDCNFSSALIFECDFSDAEVEGADFRGIDPDSNFFTRKKDGTPIVVSGKIAIGYLKFLGAITDDINPYYELMHHPKFPIIYKICEHVSDQKISQLRGLTQRGVAASDPPFARDFVDHMKNQSLIEIVRNDQVSVTAAGRKELPRLLAHDELPPTIEHFLRTYKG